MCTQYADKCPPEFITNWTTPLQQQSIQDFIDAGVPQVSALANEPSRCAALSRRWCGFSCLGMIAVSAAYLIGSIVWTPVLWLDPLGPMVKVFPVMMLALFVAAIVDER